MIVRRRVRDLEPDRHHVEESLGIEIRTKVEHELIRSGAQLLSLQQDAAPVGDDKRPDLDTAEGEGADAIDLDAVAALRRAA